ncbi:MAG: hypothetical protein JWN25_3108 [Verrucomicrobiales bacterium]|jgi:hypothetical protein|nr:hypothetical protein [Verrucomicrobiales bacterium]
MQVRLKTRILSGLAAFLKQEDIVSTHPAIAHFVHHFPDHEYSHASQRALIETQRKIRLWRSQWIERRSVIPDFHFDLIRFDFKMNIDMMLLLVLEPVSDNIAYYFFQGKMDAVQDFGGKLMACGKLLPFPVNFGEILDRIANLQIHNITSSEPLQRSVP